MGAFPVLQVLDRHASSSPASLPRLRSVWPLGRIDTASHSTGRHNNSGCPGIPDGQVFDQRTKHTARYDLAVSLINASGGVTIDGRSYALEILYYDDESTPARGALLAERLIVQDNVAFLLGPYSSGLTMAMAPITESYGVPMVEANGSSAALFDKGYATSSLSSPRPGTISQVP